jgi:hypothetical protein
MNNLWYRSIDRTQRSLHQLGRRQIFGLWKTYLIRGTLNLRFDSRTRYIQSRQVEQVLPQPRDIAGGKIVWSDIESKVDKEVRDHENGDGDKGSQTALHVDTCSQGLEKSLQFGRPPKSNSAIHFVCQAERPMRRLCEFYSGTQRDPAGMRLNDPTNPLGWRVVKLESVSAADTPLFEPNSKMVMLTAEKTLVSKPIHFVCVASGELAYFRPI